MREGRKGLSSTKRRKIHPFARVSTIRTGVYSCNPHREKGVGSSLTEVRHLTIIRRHETHRHHDDESHTRSNLEVVAYGTFSRRSHGRGPVAWRCAGTLVHARRGDHARTCRVCPPYETDNDRTRRQVRGNGTRSAHEGDGRCAGCHRLANALGRVVAWRF